MCIVVIGCCEDVEVVSIWWNRWISCLSDSGVFFDVVIVDSGCVCNC